MVSPAPAVVGAGVLEGAGLVAVGGTGVSVGGTDVSVGRAVTAGTVGGELVGDSIMAVIPGAGSVSIAWIAVGLMGASGPVWSGKLQADSPASSSRAASITTRDLIVKVRIKSSHAVPELKPHSNFSPIVRPKLVSDILKFE
jgi:hypothetical protein